MWQVVNYRNKRSNNLKKKSKVNKQEKQRKRNKQIILNKKNNKKPVFYKKLKVHLVYLRKYSVENVQDVIKFLIINDIDINKFFVNSVTVLEI